VYQVRIHGRGGQGVVTAAELLSVAAFNEGRHAQAFPTFGSERMGAPVVSFCRIADRRLRNREPISEPDVVIVQDPTLLHDPHVLAGLKPEGLLLINTSRDVAIDRARVVTVAATVIAREELGRPLPNAALLGGFAALNDLVGIEALASAIADRFGGETGDRNIAAARRAYDEVRREVAIGA
jgi:pyruvate ferredoxin oxidoreductase gamma subunit